jgi:prepilin signal peptidase PulO-like enzyme (type II secretory pathway)
MANDWTVTVADRIDSTVGIVRDKAVAPITSIARWIVYGLVVAAVGTMALVLFVVAAIRAMDEWIPQEVWLPYLILGAIFTLAGLFLLRMANKRPDAAGTS